MPLSQPPEVAYIVQSVPSRRKVRSRLLKQVPLAVVVEDSGPSPGNPWRGYRLCIEAIPRGATHAVIIQDDAVVCRNFVAAVDRVIEACPDHPVVLFYPGSKLHSSRERRRAQGKTLFKMNRLDHLPVVATLWPVDKARFFYEWSADAKLPGMRKPYRSDDAVGGYWMRLCRQDVYVTMPSLVQHPDDVAPVKDGDHVEAHGANKGRVAFQFVEGDPLEIEWRA